jgi:hypothetical protein
MPGQEDPPRGPPGINDQSAQRRPGEGGEIEKRHCRICGDTINDPYPNQYDCLECEEAEGRDELSRPETSTVEAPADSEDPGIVPGPTQTSEPNLSDLQEDIKESDLPPIRMKPEDKRRILNRIDGAGNEKKFRDLHLDGDWKRYYGEDEYQNPYETAVIGYLRIVAFYTRLSVLHMEAFYRASALYDPDFWEGWNRLNALETSLEEQANADPDWRMYGFSDTEEERLQIARERLSLIERQMDR